MTVMLGIDALEGAITMREAIDLLERTLAHDAQGRTSASPKYVTDFPGGAMRILVAADAEAGYLATKAYHSIQGTGTRYVVSLYRLTDGELLAILDGRVITDLRTGAASGVIARRVPIAAPVTLGLLGSGNQARTQLESLASVYRIDAAEVFSPTKANREAFARGMSEKLGLSVKAVGSAEAAVRGKAVVATASSSRSPDPILHGEWLESCRLVCAVGNTRPQFAEIDVRCFRDAALVVVDSRHALEEAGDLRQAVKAGALPQAKQATLGEVITGKAEVPREGLVVFKSVGMALQDLALAARYHELLGGREEFAAPAVVASLRD